MYIPRFRDKFDKLKNLKQKSPGKYFLIHEIASLDSLIRFMDPDVHTNVFQQMNGSVAVRHNSSLKIVPRAIYIANLRNGIVMI